MSDYGDLSLQDPAINQLLGQLENDGETDETAEGGGDQQLAMLNLLSRKMEKTQMISLVSNLMKLDHDMNKSVIDNIRAK